MSLLEVDPDAGSKPKRKFKLASLGSFAKAQKTIQKWIEEDVKKQKSLLLFIS
jgi:hypothetical protein